MLVHGALSESKSISPSYAVGRKFQEFSGQDP
jgi:hypothetical protein